MKRTVKKQFWLTPQEDAKLKEKAQKTCLTEAALLRMLIKGFVPREAPPPAFYETMQQLSLIGNNLNQIARKAHTLQYIDAQALHRELEALQNFRLEVMERFLAPKRSSEETDE